MPSVELIGSPPLRFRLSGPLLLPGRAARRVDDQDLRRADDPLADPVAGLGDHLAGGHLDLRVLPDVGEGLVDRRVEPVADGAELGQAEPGDDPLELVRDRLESVLERRVLAGTVDRVEHLGDRRESSVGRVLADQLAVPLDAPLVVEVLGLEPLEVGGQVGHVAPCGEQVALELDVPGHATGPVSGHATGPVSGHGAGLRRGLDLGLVGHLGRGVTEAAGRGPLGRSRSGLLRLLLGSDARLGSGVGHLLSPSLVSVSSSTISASTTSSSASPVAPVAPPAAADSASAAAYMAAPIFWLDSPSLVTPAWISSADASAFSRVALRASTSALTSTLTSSGIFSPFSSRNFSVE